MHIKQTHRDYLSKIVNIKRFTEEMCDVPADHEKCDHVPARCPCYIRIYTQVFHCERSIP